MKKMMAFLLISCVILCTGCFESEKNQGNQSQVKVYSFSGENEYFAVSNGVFVSYGQDEICHGGDLKVLSDDFADITEYSVTIYINGSEKEILLKNAVIDKTGGTLSDFGEIGSFCGNILDDEDLGRLPDNLYLELKTTDTSGEENAYQLQLETTEVTKLAQNDRQ